MKKIIEAPGFDLHETLDSGQLFRWWKSPHDGFILAIGDRVFPVRQIGNRLETWTAHQDDKDFLRRFLALNIDIDEIQREVIKGGLPKSIAARWRGLRIVRQSPWECLASFVCSSANNIARIRGMLQRLCKYFGRPVEHDGSAGLYPPEFVSHSFPEPDAIEDEPALRRLGFGFRAKYLSQIACMVANGWLDGLDEMDYASAKTHLVELPGVGNKVADCALLFSLGHGEAYPIDTWIRRASWELFFGGKKVSDAVIHREAIARFGNYAGYAQQYIYHEWRRNAGRIVKTDFS